MHNHLKILELKKKDRKQSLEAILSENKNLRQERGCQNEKKTEKYKSNYIQNPSNQIYTYLHSHNPTASSI